MTADGMGGSLERLLWRITDHARGAIGDFLPLAMTVAQMLTAANAPSDTRAARDFLNISAELTTGGWTAILHDLATTERRVRTALSLRNPIDHDANSFPPGMLEHIRRELLSFSIPRNGERVPASVLQTVFDLARKSRDEVPTVSQEGQLLVAECLQIRSEDRVYCAYSGTAGIALSLAAERGCYVSLEAREADTTALCAWLAAAGRLNLDIQVSDPLERARFSEDWRWGRASRADHDVAIVNPPFGEARDRSYMEDLCRRTGLPVGSNLEAFHVMLAATHGRRVAACLMPNGFLFRTTKSDQVFKEQAIRSLGLDAVVGLPRGTLGRHSAVQASMIFFQSDRRTLEQRSRQDFEVLMVDARREADLAKERGSPLNWPRSVAQIVRDRTENETSALVPLTTFAEQDFNLTVDRYVLDSETRRVRDMIAHSAATLDDVAELYRPQALFLGGRGRSTELPELAVETENGDLLLEVSVTDIDEVGIVRRPTKEVPATSEVVQRSRKSRLEPGDMLLVNKGSVGKVGYVRDIPADEAWLANQSFVVIRLRRRGAIIDPLVLFRFLSSGIGQTTIRNLAVGTSIPGLQMADVRRLPVLVPPVADQEAITKQVQQIFEIQDRIDKERREISERQRTIWPESQPPRIVD